MQQQQLLRIMRMSLNRLYRLLPRECALNINNKSSNRGIINNSRDIFIMNTGATTTTIIIIISSSGSQVVGLFIILTECSSSINSSIILSSHSHLDSLNTGLLSPGIRRMRIQVCMYSLKGLCSALLIRSAFGLHFRLGGWYVLTRIGLNCVKENKLKT